MDIACLDLEGVLFGEIWINFSQQTGIEKLKLTTRDIPDYDVLMRQRLQLLKENGLGLPHIQAVIDKMEPLDGALDFVDWLRQRFQDRAPHGPPPDCGKREDRLGGQGMCAAPFQPENG